MKPIIKAPLNEKLDIKYKLIVTAVDQYRGDVKVDIKFNSAEQYSIAKQHFNRNAIIRLFTGLKTPDNHIFVRKFGYFDLSNTITIIINGPVAQDDTFLIQVEQIAKMAIKKQLANKEQRDDQFKQNVQNLRQPYTPKQNKINTKPIIKQSIYQYPKAKSLFDSTIQRLRKSFKQFNNDQLWAFGVEMRSFFKNFVD